MPRSFEIKERGIPVQLTRVQREKNLKQELSNLKAELRKAKGEYKRSVLMNEIRAVARQLESLRECI